MDKNEKILLLELILRDIRGNWGFDLDQRVDKALELAKELDLKSHITSIKEYIKCCRDGYNDGRFFRCSYKNGGYEGMGILHGLDERLINKSNEFKNAINILTYPEYRFVDWDEYNK